MHTRVALRKSACCTGLVYIILICTLKTRLFALQTGDLTRVFSLQPVYTQLLSLKPTYFLCRCQKKMFHKFWVVWVVMQLTPSVVTTLSSTLYLQKGINRGREVDERRLEYFHCYAGEIGALIPPTFSLEYLSLCCKAWRLSSLEKRNNKTRSRFL